MPESYYFTRIFRRLDALAVACFALQHASYRRAIMCAILAVTLIINNAAMINASPPASTDNAKSAEIGNINSIVDDNSVFERDARAPRPKFIRFGRAGQKFIRFGRSSWDYDAIAPLHKKDAELNDDMGVLPLRRYLFAAPKREQKFIRFG